MIYEWYDRIPEEDQSLALSTVRHIRQLLWRYIQMLCEYLPVSRGLVQHVYKVAVLKDIFYLRACKEILDVLCDPGRDAAPLSEALPYLHAVSSCLFLFKQQMEFIHIVSCRPVRIPVYRYPVPDLIVYYEHSQLFKLLSKSLDIKADDPVVKLHICPVIKDIKRPVYIYL